MKVVRTIVYEGTPEQIHAQLSQSLQDGMYRWLTDITVKTDQVEGAAFTAKLPAGSTGGWWDYDKSNRT